jgi:hypothetical protein
VNDKELLKTMLQICDRLLNKSPNFYGKDTNDKKKGIECDNEYNENNSIGMPELEINAEAIYSEWWKKETKILNPLEVEPESTKCATCNHPWANILGKYGCVTSSALLGSKSDINYIIMNILLDMSSSQNGLNDNDNIKKNITYILQNIECRSDLRQLIRERIHELENPKKIK